MKKNTEARSGDLDLSHSTTIYWLKTLGKSLLHLKLPTCKIGTFKGLHLKFTDINVSLARAGVLILVVSLGTSGTQLLPSPENCPLLSHLFSGLNETVH